MLVGIIGLIISIAMAVWIYQVVNKNGGKLPWLWAIGAFVLWPLVITIIGFKYNETAMLVTGLIGLGFVVLCVVLGVGLVKPL